MAGIGGLIGGIGGAVTDIFTGEAAAATAQGDRLAAASYNYGGFLENQNASSTEVATGIQKVQVARKISQTEGTMVASEGEANVSGGSAGDLMRSSMQQGALAQTMVSTQGQITENAFKEKAVSLQGMAAAANAAADAADKQAQMAPITAGLSILGGFAGMF